MPSRIPAQHGRIRCMNLTGASAGASQWVDRFGQQQRKGSDILVQALEREGINTVFAYPGGASLEIHQALTRSDTVRNILCRHEQVPSSMIITSTAVSKPASRMLTASSSMNLAVLIEWCCFWWKTSKQAVKARPFYQNSQPCIMVHTLRSGFFCWMTKAKQGFSFLSIPAAWLDFGSSFCGHQLLGWILAPQDRLDENSNTEASLSSSFHGLLKGASTAGSQARSKQVFLLDCPTCIICLQTMHPKPRSCRVHHR